MSARTKYINVTSSGADNFIFVSAFVIGILWILLTRLFFNLSAVIAVFGPLLCLFSYSYLLSSGRFRLREDRAADNLYYLGFLFTLASLGIGLYRYDSEISDVGSIISDLGVGLTSTIVGLFLRILFLQLRVDPSEAGEDAKVELSRAIESFRADVASIQEISRQASTVIQQQFQESYSEYQSSITELISSTKLLGTQISSFNKRIGKIEIPDDLITSRAETAFLRFEGLITDISGRISLSTKAVETEFDSLSRRIADVKIDQSTIFPQIDATSAAIVARLSKTLDGLVPLEKSLFELRENFEKSAQAVSEINRKLQFPSGSELSIVGSLVELNGNIESIALYTAQITALPSIVRELSDDIRSLCRDIKEGSAHLAISMTTASSAVLKIESEANEMCRGLRSVTTELSEAIREIIEVANR
jgi:hypothetical protein